jgi:hypothetical protein
MRDFVNSAKAICLALLIGTAGDAFSAPRLCASLRDAHNLETIDVENPEWNLRVPNVDFDGDGVSDQIRLFKSDSPSKWPGDLVKAQVVPSTTNRPYLAEFPHIVIRRFRSHIYLVGITYSENGRTALQEAHVLGGKGITKVCSITQAGESVGAV